MMKNSMPFEHKIDDQLHPPPIIYSDQKKKPKLTNKHINENILDFNQDKQNLDERLLNYMMKEMKDKLIKEEQPDKDGEDVVKITSTGMETDYRVITCEYVSYEMQIYKVTKYVQ